MFSLFCLLSAVAFAAPPPPAAPLLADSVHVALDAIVAAGPLRSSVSDLLALPWGDANRSPSDLWLSHVRIHTDKAGGQRIEVWSVTRLAEGVDGTPLETLSFESIPGVTLAPVVRARVVCPTGQQTFADPAPVTENKPVERNRAFTAIRDAVVSLPPVKGGCLREVHRVTDWPATLVDQAHDHGTWTFVGSAVEQRITVSTDPGVPLSGATIVGDEPPRIQPVVRLDDGAPSVSLWLRRKHLQNETPGDGPRLLWELGDATWSDLAAACAKRVEPVLAEALPSTALPPVSKGRTPLHTVRAIAAEVRERMDLQPLDWSTQAFVVSKPSDILARRLATSFDHAVVLAAALRREGFDAHVGFFAGHAPSTAFGGERPGRNPIEHPLVYIPASGKDSAIWVDARTPDIPAGALPYALVRGRAWLCASHPAAASGLLQLHPIPNAVDTIHVKRHAVLQTLADTRIEAEVLFDGPRADIFRQFTPRSRPTGLAEELYWVAPRALEGELVSAAIAHDDGVGPLTARVASDGSVATDTWHTLVLPSAYFDAWTYLPEVFDPARTSEPGPFDFVYPQIISSETTLELPPGFEPDGPLPSLELQLGRATWRYASTFTPASSGTRARITTTTALDFGPASWSREEVKAFREVLASYRKQDDDSPTFSHRAYEALAHGDATIGAKLFQALRTEYPNDPTTAALLAIAWLQRGLVPLAADVLANTRTVDRNHPMWSIAEALLLDTAREGRGGADAVAGPAFIAAWRKAFEAAPGHAGIAMTYATALVGTEMLWYRPTRNELDDGVGRLRTMALIDGNPAALTAYLQALWHLGDMKQLLNDTRSQRLPADALHFFLAARVVTEGMRGLAAEVARLATEGYALQALETAVMRVTVLLMSGNHWGILGTFAPDDKVVAPLIRFGKRYDNTRATALAPIDRNDPWSVASAYLLAVYGTDAFTARGGGDVIVDLTHDDFKTLARDFLVDNAVPWRSVGPVLTSLTHVAIQSARQQALRSKTGDDAVGVRFEVQLPDRLEVLHLAPRAGNPREWAVVPANATGATLYNHAARLALAGDDAGAQLWFEWAERVRHKSSLGTSTPSLATDPATRLADATRLALHGLPTDDVLAHAIGTLRPDEHAAWTDVAHLLLLRERHQEAHAVFARLPEDLRSGSDLALTAMLRSLSPAEAKAWCEAHVRSIPPTVPLSRVIMRIRPHIGDAAWSAAMMEARAEVGEATVSTNNRVWTHVMANTLTEASETLIRQEVAHQRAAFDKELAARIGGTPDGLLRKVHALPNTQLRRVLHTLSSVLLARGKVDEAVAVVAEALPHDRSMEAWDFYLLARLAAGLGFSDEAARLVARIDAASIQKDPDLALLLKRGFGRP